MVKNNVAPLQAAQAALIAKRVALINLRLTMYREQFKMKEVSDCITCCYMVQNGSYLNDLPNLVAAALLFSLFSLVKSKPLHLKLRFTNRDSVSQLYKIPYVKAVRFKIVTRISLRYS